jgi:hypothetical protein
MKQETKRRPTIGIAGLFQQGKSTLLNCLLHGCYARTGDGLATTHILTRYRHGLFEEVRLLLSDEETPFFVTDKEDFLTADHFPDKCRIELICPGEILRYLDIIDTPGFDADNKDDTIAKIGVDEADLLVIVVEAKELHEAVTTHLLNPIHKSGKPFVVLMNCREMSFQRQAPSNRLNEKIARNIEADLFNKGFEPLPIQGKNVWPCNLLWAWHAGGNLKRDFDSGEKRALIKSHFDGNLPSNEEIMNLCGFEPVFDFLVDWGKEYYNRNENIENDDKQDLPGSTHI